MNDKGFSLERGLEGSEAKHLDVVRYKVQETQKELDTTEKELLEKRNELKKVSQTFDKSLEILSDEKEKVPFKKRETKTVKVGFMKTEEQETGNYILSEKHMKELSRKINAAADIKKDYERMKNTDLVQENDELKRYIKRNIPLLDRAKNRIDALKEENTELSQENNRLKGQISDLKRDVRLVYESTKEFLKERTDGLKAFKNVFKGFVDKVKDKTAQFRKKNDLGPKKNEFELTHNREVKKERNRDQGMSL